VVLGHNDPVVVALEEGGLAMSIVHECSAENCRTLTMGQFCVEHEQNEVFEEFFATEIESRRADPPAVTARQTPFRGRSKRATGASRSLEGDA
jgi:hypothetical protein